MQVHKIFIFPKICYTLEIEPYHLSEKTRLTPGGVIATEVSSRVIPARIGNYGRDGLINRHQPRRSELSNFNIERT